MIRTFPCFSESWVGERGAFSLRRSKSAPAPFPPRARGREENKSRSRNAPWHPRFAARFKKALPKAPLNKKGGGAPFGASTGNRLRRRRRTASLLRTRRAPSLLSRIGAGSKRRRPRLAALHRGHAPKVFASDSARAALPGITGSKREDPLRHQCSQHLAVRSRAGRSMPRPPGPKMTTPGSGNRTRRISRRHRLTSPDQAG